MDGSSGREVSALDEFPLLHQPSLVENRYETLDDHTSSSSKSSVYSTVRADFLPFCCGLWLKWGAVCVVDKQYCRIFRTSVGKVVVEGRKEGFCGQLELRTA